MQSRFHQQYYSVKRNSNHLWRRWLGAGIGLAALAVLVYQIPFVNSRLAWRLDNLRANIFYFFNPPSEAVFTPGDLSSPAVQITSRPTATPASVEAEGTATPTLEPLPSSLMLEGFRFVTQQGAWNYCGPATLAMSLNFWGWAGDRHDIAQVIKPGENNPSKNFIDRGYTDKNVMPYEMEYFVNDYTDLQAITRVGGEMELLKRLVAKGFPVVIEKGYYEADYRGIVDWLGHYLFVTGYDEERQAFIVQDSWDSRHPGENVDSPYDLFLEGWRSFNFLFMVIYPPERSAEVFEVLGPWADEEWATRHAMEVAERETRELSGIDQYFAWFNKGSNHVALFEYVDAASAYDYAFQVYAALDDSTLRRPYRMMWYQTGPYWAYFYSGRYQDVINLANTTLTTLADPTLEESIYWRGRARLALGEVDNAISDFRQTVYLNQYFRPGLDMLQELGVSP